MSQGRAQEVNVTEKLVNYQQRVVVNKGCASSESYQLLSGNEAQRAAAQDNNSGPICRVQDEQRIKTQTLHNFHPENIDSHVHPREFRVYKFSVGLDESDKET